MVAGKPKACPHCLYVPFCAGADWGYHEGVQGDWASCVHITGQRNCQSCSSIWWKLGNDSGWDVDGAPSEDCPECSAFTGRTAPGKKELLTNLQRRVEELNCQACPNGHGVRRVELINGTMAHLCSRCVRSGGVALIREPFERGHLAVLAPLASDVEVQSVQRDRRRDCEAVLNNCKVCSKATPANDRIVCQTGFAHAACLWRVQLERAPSGRVLVMVRRTGPAFQGRAV